MQYLPEDADTMHPHRVSVSADLQRAHAWTSALAETMLFGMLLSLLKNARKCMQLN